MQVIGRGDADHVEILLLQHFAIVGVFGKSASRDLGAFEKAAQSRRVDVAGGYQFVFLCPGIGIAVGAAQTAADYRRAQSLRSHDYSILSRTKAAESATWPSCRLCRINAPS